MAKSPPSSPFYWNDYYRDTRVLQPQHRGIWMDVLCKLHESGRRGEVAIPLLSWLAWTGCDQDLFLTAAVDIAVNDVGIVHFDGVDARGHFGDMSRNVPSCPVNVPVMVTVKNRRMVREQNTREYERLKKEKQRVGKTSPRQSRAGVPNCPPVPSSSSSSSSEKERIPPNPPLPGGTATMSRDIRVGGKRVGGLVRLSEGLKKIFYAHLDPPGNPAEGEGAA